MWILPKQLHTSPCVPDTAALISDCEQLSLACEQSLWWRGKHSQSAIWSRRWNLGGWIHVLSGRMLRPSEASGVEAWISYQVVTPASHLVQPAGAKAKRIRDTFGLTYAKLSRQPDLLFASSRTWKDTYRSASEKYTQAFDVWVMQLRLEYSQRLKAVCLTRESASLSWPTIGAADAKTGYQRRHDGAKGTQENLETVVRNQQAPANPNTGGSRPELCATPEGMGGGKTSRGGKRKGELLLTGQVRQWATPEARNQTGYHNQKDGSKILKLGSQVQWATPRASDPQHSGPNMRGSKGDQPLPAQVQNWLTPKVPSGGGQATRETPGGGLRKLEDQTEPMDRSAKLNPRWVETLMGLPIGWTMPSCASPVTPGSMSCDCSETVSCQQPQPRHSSR